MPCYSYTSNEPIYYSPNNGDWSVERVYTASGPTYSYAAIARICEVPAADQLCVYTRPNPTGTETKLTLGLDYTVNTTTENIVLTGSATGQVVIRRCTPNNKMLFKFVNGAKITAEQLNASLYQLLFISQEKEFVGSTVNEYYPIAIGASNWSSTTAYIPNNYVLYNGSIYRALVNNTNSAPPNSNWALVNPSSNGFVIQGGETITGPIKFNLANVTAGSGLVWTGSEFSAGTISGLINDLSDVEITTPLNDKSILVYNATVSRWQNKLPTVDITQNNLILRDFVFYGRQGNSTEYSYSRLDTPIAAPTFLDTFKDAANQYVLTHAPTVYHIVKKLIPTSDPPETFFANVYSILNQVAVNVSNPVKVQLYWNLNRGVPATDTLQDVTTSEKLVSYKLSFWDSPREFYDPQMFSNIQLLNVHGINAIGTTLYQDNPFFFRSSGTNPDQFYSKISGKGVKAFYLNVPECYNTALCNIPITFTDAGVTSFFQRSNLQLAALRDANSASYRDEYLTALRDYAFAGVRSPLSTVTSFKDYDSQARYAKSWLLSVDYHGWENISYRRLEIQNETQQTCLFKMPKQIIYYNKEAMVFDADNTSQATTGSGWPNTAVDSSVASGDQYSKTVRFTGTGVLTLNSTTASTTSYSSMGSLFKSDGFWGNWCSKWEADPVVFHFNEADIDWAVGNIQENSNITLNLWAFTSTTQDLPGPTSAGTLDVGYNLGTMYPWPYRPNHYEKTNATYDRLIGTHFFNMESNTLFSTATNFVPDPRDEYVFRLVVKDDLFNAFNKAGSHNIASAIILEHGFNEHPENAERNKIQDGIVNIYRKNQTPRQIQRTKTRLSKNDVKVFIQSEHFEKVDNTTNQYVINLCISVPRLKAIGYARVFRQSAGFQNDYNVYKTSTTIDSEADLGPWTFYIDNDILNQPVDLGKFLSGSNLVIEIQDQDGLMHPTFYNTNGGNAGGQSRRVAVAGRNECAVKFTRLGIPNNLWIRMSVLNTDGTTEFVQSTGFSFT